MINLTQHAATPAQLDAGVVDAPAEWGLSALLTFDTLPAPDEILARAAGIAALAADSGHDSAMIGGAMWLMAPLAHELLARGVRPFFAFSIRRSVDQPQADGSVRKIAAFDHAGFVPAWSNGGRSVCHIVRNYSPSGGGVCHLFRWSDAAPGSPGGCTDEGEFVSTWEFLLPRDVMSQDYDTYAWRSRSITNGMCGELLTTAADLADAGETHWERVYPPQAGVAA